MKFYDRTDEITELKNAKTLSKSIAQFTVVTGRRRIGKTALVRKAYEGEDDFVYFFVTRKSEKELCQGFKKEIEEKLNIPILGNSDKFADIFEYLMKLSTLRPLTLFIDEFQEFYKINPSIFSEMQRIWDLYQENSKINLVVCGSLYNMMTKIFRDKKEPLYNRENRFMKIKPFGVAVLKEILRDHNPGFTNDDLLALFSFTGGVAKYVQLLMDAGAVDKDLMINAIVNSSSPFLGEGKSLLIEEFGKEYGTYFSILSAISRGRTSRIEIEDTVGREISGFLTRLEDDYELITRHRPVFEKNPRRNVRYLIRDNFLLFWFRFIFRHAYMLEIDAYESLREIIKRDYDVFSGKMLERYFTQLFIEGKSITRIGSWWDRKGENEIDIVAENELTQELIFGEVKRQKDRYNEHTLRLKSESFFKSVGQFEGYETRFCGLSLEDM